MPPQTRDRRTKVFCFFFSKKKSFLPFLLFLLFLTGARAQDSNAPIAFVRQVGNELPRLLANTTTIEQRRERLRPFVSRVVDLDATAQFCLGRYWARTAAPQQQEIESLFLAVVVNEIAIWTGRSGSSGIPTSVDMQPAFTTAGRTYVPTLVHVGIAPPAHIDWVVNMASTPPRILDVTAEGISLRETLRSDFVSYLNHHGGDVGALILLLRKRAEDQGGMSPHLAGAPAPAP